MKTFSDKVYDLLRKVPNYSALKNGRFGVVNSCLKIEESRSLEVRRINSLCCAFYFWVSRFAAGL